MIHKSIFFKFILLSSLIVGCSPSSSHRQSIRDQNEANVGAEMADLAPAESDYNGTMTMLKSGQTFQANLAIKRVYENVRPNQPLDPTQTINLPKLNGYLKFPVIDKLDISDYGTYSEIINPMGGFSSIIIDFGDYDPKTNLLILPYNVSGYTQGNFGELQGTLKNGIFTGTWFAKPLGTIGKFSLAQIPSERKSDQ